MNQQARTLQESESKLSENWLADLLIRPLRETDLLSLEWEGRYTHFRRLYRLAFQRAQMGNAALWVADLPTDKVLGQLFVLLRSEVDAQLADGKSKAFVHSFRVRPEYRNAGLGRRLLANAESDLLRRGFRSVTLNVAIENSAAIRFYERAGYVRSGRDEGYWTYLDHRGRERDVHEPSWKMSKNLKRAQISGDL
jgi:ribosomal protein S18 acetylase RimI-like enzyme